MLLPGSSIPSAFILWSMRELPPSVAAKMEEASTITFITDSTVTVQHSQRWTTAMSLQNQVCTSCLLAHSSMQ
jgi:hypothetical protein